MKQEDEFTLWLARAILQTTDEEVKIIELEDLADQVGAGEDLELVVDRASNADHQPGDFGMEIAGSLLIPVLVEIGKQLWAAFSKKLTDQAFDELAKATIVQIKSKVFPGKADDATRLLVRQLEDLIQTVGKKRGLAAADLEKLVKAVKSESFTNELRSSSAN